MTVIPRHVHSMFSLIMFVFSLLLNCVSIFVILAAPNGKKVGTYRCLLLLFCVVDFMISLGHALLTPRVYATDFGYIFVAHNFATKGADYGTIGAIIFVALFYQTFNLRCLCFLYRLLSVMSCRILKGKAKFASLTFGIMYSICYSIGFVLVLKIGYLPTPEKRQWYNPFLKEWSIDIVSDNSTGFLAIVYRPPSTFTSTFHNDAIAAISVGLGLFFVPLVGILTCSMLIIRMLRDKTKFCSAANRKAHKELFRVLIVQTTIPLLFAYFPLGVIFVLPLFGIDLGGFISDGLIMTTAIFTALNGFIMIVLMPDFRSYACYTIASLVGMKARYNEMRAGRSTTSVTVIQPSTSTSAPPMEHISTVVRNAGRSIATLFSFARR